jgi:ABC-type lipoprotein export system ATPase subunit
VTASELRAEGIGLDLGGRTLLEGIGLTARAGEPLAISGPSGSGKTVLLLVLAGLLSPTRGTVLVDGAPIGPGHDRPDVGFGIVLQTQGLVPELTADENVALPLQSRGLATGEVADRTTRALTAVGLDALLLDPAPPRIVVVASNDPEVSSACRHVLHLRDGRMDAGD